MAFWPFVDEPDVIIARVTTLGAVLVGTIVAIAVLVF